MSNLEHALKYIKRGWSIIPIQPGNKLPILKSWTKWQTQIPTEKDVRRWWDTFPDAGIALVCGKISGVIVVDIDPKNGGSTKGINLPPTLAQKTGGGGQHYIYKWREGLVGAKVGVVEGVDIRSDNSYAIIPPSLHQSGNLYEWFDEDEDIADAPDWLNAKEQPKVTTDWSKFLTEKKGKGLRNMSTTQLAGKIMYEMSPDMWEPLGYPIMQQWNKEHNSPTLPESELRTIWESIQKTHLKNNAPAVNKMTDDPEADEDDPFYNDRKTIVKEFKKNKAKATFWLAKHLTEKFNIITVGEKEREMYVYRDGMYFRAENEIIFPSIQEVLTEEVTKSAKMETFHKIADMTSKSRDVFESASFEFIPLKNGVYNLNTKELLPHSPDYRFTYQFPISYDPQAIPPKTIKFMEQVLNADQIQTVQEWIGYYFYRFYMFKKAIIFVGEGDTGKTTLLEVITFLLGKDNISSVSLQKMTGDKFAAAHLYEKHGNLVDELSARDISDTGNFKIATGGGSISGEYKFGNQFSFHNFSKFTFACNKIPDVKDFDDEAYFNRWMVIRFENPIAKKIPNFIQTLTTEEERSGLFNWAMEGLVRLVVNGGFTYSKSAMDTKKEMMRSGSSIAMFSAEGVTQAVGAEMSKEDMYQAYTEFCAENGLAAETIKMFGTKFPFYVAYATDGLIDEHRGGRKTARVRGWRNVALVKNASEHDKSEHDFEHFNDPPKPVEEKIVIPEVVVPVQKEMVVVTEAPRKYADDEINPEDIPF